MVEVLLVCFFPQSQLTSDFNSCCRCVASDNFNVDAGIHAALHSFGHIGTYRVGYCHNTLENKVISNQIISFAVK